MTPFQPHPDANSSSFAYLDNLPPGTNPYVTPDPGQNSVPRSPRVYNTPETNHESVQGQDDGMDVDTGDASDASDTGDTADAADTVANLVLGESPDIDTGRSPKRSRSGDSGANSLEYSEPELKRQRLSPSDTAIVEIVEPVTLPAETKPQDFKKYAKSAAMTGNLDGLKRIVDQYEIKKDDFGEWELAHIAAEYGHLNILKWLVEQGEDAGHTNKKGYTVLQVAAQNGHLNVIQWLVEQGSDIQQTDDYDRNLVGLAAKSGHLDVIKWLHQKGCDIHHCNGSDQNAFLFAAKAGELEVMKWLAEQGSDIQHTTTWDANALTYAAEYGHLDVAEWLIEKGCDLNIVDENGNSSIYWAVINNHADIVRLLIRHEVKISADIDGRPNPLLFEAIRNCTADIVEMLIPYYDISVRDPLGFTPLMLAGHCRAYDSLVPLIWATLKHPKANELLNEAGAKSPDLLAKELISQTSFLSPGALEHSHRKADRPVVIMSQFVLMEVEWKHRQLGELQLLLGSKQSLTAMQSLAATNGILAGLVPWKISHYPNGNFYNVLGPIKRKYPELDKDYEEFWKGVQERLNTFTAEDIEILTEMAYHWEEENLSPVFENLFETCLGHALSDDPESAIVGELTAKGIYHPLAEGIAKAWQKAWKPVLSLATPLLKPDSVTFEEWEIEDLAGLDPTTGSLPLTPATIGRKMDGFLETSVATTLSTAFKIALRENFDSVAGNYLRINDPNLTKSSKELYADLMNRQINMLAQLWNQ